MSGIDGRSGWLDAGGAAAAAVSWTGGSEMGLEGTLRVGVSSSLIRWRRVLSERLKGIPVGLSEGLAEVVAGEGAVGVCIVRSAGAMSRGGREMP